MNRFLFSSLWVVVLMAGGCLLPACDGLNLQSDGSITMQEVFNDRNRTRGYLNACYDNLPGTLFQAGSYTDDAEDSEDATSGSVFDYWYKGGVNASNFASYAPGGAPWNGFYQGIRRCNVFLANIDAATAYATDAEKAAWKAQAKVLRAFYYLELFKRYGKVPLLLAERPKDYDYSQDRKAGVGEVVTQILKDCDEALAVSESNDFPWGVQNNQWGMMTRAVAHAIRSQAVTFAVSPLFDDGTFSMQQATEVTGSALAACLNHDYSLFTESDGYHNAYGSYFLYGPDDLRARDKETIFRGDRVAAWQNAGLPTTEGMTKAGPCPTQDLVDAYEMADGTAPIMGYEDDDHLKPIINPESTYDEQNPYEGRDPRFYATVYYNGARHMLDGSDETPIETFVGGRQGISEKSRQNTHTGYYLHKYAHFLSNKNSNSDGYVRLFRLPELLFNFAETASQAYSPDEKIELGGGVSLSARDAVNIVRKRAGMPDFPEGMSKEEFQKKYRNERRIEYAMEQLRYFDVRRWKILEQTEKFVTGMRITRNSDGTFTYNRFRFEDRATHADKYLLFPLDVTEVSKMMKLTGDNWQNAGW